MKTFKKVISAAMCAAVAVSQLTALTPAVNAAEELADSLANDSGLDIDYARALQYSIYFYDAYIKVLLEHLGIGHKFEEIVNVIPLTEEEKIANAKEEMIKLLDEYCANSIIEVCVEGEYTEIPKFTERVNNIYKSVYDKAINSQWANRKRTVADNIFNDFIKELGLPYNVEISAKDKTTGAKTLTVTKI